MNQYHCYKPIKISGFSAAKFDSLVERLGHSGLTVTATDKGYGVSGDDLAGNISHDSSADTLTLEIQQVPTIVTPGYLVGRFYDEILTLGES